MGGTLRRDKADLVDLLHRTGAAAHDGGDGDLGSLPHLDAVLIGIAVIEGDAQLGVVDDGGDGVALVHRISRLQVGHLPQVAGMRGLDGQLPDLFIDRLELLLAVVHRLLGSLDGLPGRGVVHAVEGLALGDLVTLLHIELQNGTGTRCNSGRFVGLGHAAAFHLHLDGPQLNGVGHGFTQSSLILPEHKVPQSKDNSGNHRRGNEQAHDQLDLTAALFLSGAGRRPSRRRLARSGPLEHRRLLIRHIELLLVYLLVHCHSSIPGKVSNDKAMTNS